MQAQQVLCAFDFKDVADAGQGLNLVEIGADALPRVDGAFVVDGVKHAGNFEVDAVKRFAGHDADVVHSGCGASDDFVILGILELDGFEVGRRDSSRSFRERTISERALCGLMDDSAGPSGAFRFGDGPGLRGGSNKHLAAGSADATERVPVDGCGGAATGALRAILRFFEIGLLDANVFPIHIKLFGDEHGQAGFDALTDFRIFAHDSDDAVSGNADEGKRLERRCGRLRRSSLSGSGKGFGSGFEMVGEKKSTASNGRNFEKSTTIKECRIHGASFGDRRVSVGRGYVHRKHCKPIGRFLARGSRGERLLVRVP